MISNVFIQYDKKIPRFKTPPLSCHIKKKAGKNYVNFLCKKKNPIKCNGNANLRHTIIKHISEKK